MPLNPLTLQTEIRKFSDDTFAQFIGFPSDEADVAAKWGAALKVFFDEMITPVLIPGTTTLGEGAMVAVMTPLIAPIPGVGATALAAGFAAFTATFVLGGLPVIVVPPPAPFVPPPLPPTGNAALAALTLASAVVLWAITGTWTIPPALPAPWA
jgi:hypothetical protein